jgi:hypothetical protein
MKKRNITILVLPLLLILILFAIPQAALADIAPPSNPPGANPGPSEESTQVRMVAETVLINVLRTPPEGSLGQATVTADFTMLNLGSEAETMGVRFPISANDGFFNYPEIKNLQIVVNGTDVGYRRIEGLDSWGDTVPWAEFDVFFPAGKEVYIQVSYLLEGSGEYPYIAFSYLLETGAGWQGTIGSADLTVRLPYEATSGNVFLDSSPGWGETSPGALLTGNEVRWHYEELEPSRADNLSIVLVMPEAWGTVLNERQNVRDNPEDGEAWGRLGKILKEISRLRRGLRYDAGGRELYEESRQAYIQSVTLKPNDAWWHAGYAELLWNHYYWETFFTNPNDTAEMLVVLNELNQSLELDPDNPVALALLEEISYALPEAVEQTDGGFTLKWLTATPISEATSTPELDPTATLTLEPSSTLPPPTATDIPSNAEQPPPTEPPPPTPEPPPTNVPPPTPPPTAEPEPESPLPICGSALLLPLLGLMVYWKGKSE